MEEPHVRPHRRSMQPETAVDDLEEAATNPDDELDDLVTEVTQLDEKISQQEKDIEYKWAFVAERKTQTKKRVAGFFAELKEMLETKERETLDKVEKHLDKLRAPLLDTCVVNVTLDKARVNTMLKNESEYVKTFSRDDVIQSLSDLKKGVMKRDQIIRVNYEPKITINEDLRDIIQQWQCASEGSEADASTPEASAGPGNDVVYGPEYGRGSEQHQRLLDNVEGINYSEANENENGHTENVQENNRETNTGAPEGATAGPSENVQPSAPTARGQNPDEEEDPPPYWQAVGLPGPQDVRGQTRNVPSAPDLNTRTYQDSAPRYHDVARAAPTVPTNRSPSKPCNYLNVWHSFPVKRQYDHRSVLPVSLTWNHGLLCLGDRNNSKIKFFNTSGDPFAEMQFNGEIHDVAFLERCHNESRYIVTMPKSSIFCIIALKANYKTHLVRTITLNNNKPYNCISKGPQDQTLVGGSGLPSNCAPSVDIIDFKGIVKHSFMYTPNYVPFDFPKSVHVLNKFIIISDWGLSVVCVFFDDGSPVGEYSGTPQTPLTNPSDVTLDNFGNIMILDGHLSNIHVVDLKCTPIETIKLPDQLSDTRSKVTKFLAFDARTKMMAAVKNNGQLAVYSFQGGYNTVSQGTMVNLELERPEPAVLPYVEGMLPSTIENMRSRSRPRGRTDVFHL